MGPGSLGSWGPGPWGPLGTLGPGPWGPWGPGPWGPGATEGAPMTIQEYHDVDYTRIPRR